MSKIKRTPIKRVYVYNLEGEIINVFNSVNEASEKLGILRLCIYKSIVRSRNGFKSFYNLKHKYIFSNSQKLEVSKLEYNMGFGKKVCSLAEDKETVIKSYATIAEAAIDVKRHYSSVSKAVNSNLERVSAGMYWAQL